jgi:hydroxymethylpyrimidine/phosphomethylpyrimidine kinase
MTGEKFERFDTSFVGAGDTLSAALAALLAAGSELQAAVGEALSFLDQSLDAGFRPAWATSCRTASSGPAPRRRAKAPKTPGPTRPGQRRRDTPPPTRASPPRRVH